MKNASIYFVQRQKKNMVIVTVNIVLNTFRHRGTI